MLKVGICDDSICPNCKRNLKSVSKVVPWVSKSGKKVKRRTSGFICNTCKYFYVMRGMEIDDSTWEILYLVTNKTTPSKKKRKAKHKNRIYQANFPDHKSCQNCNFYTENSRCVLNNKKVKANNLCKRYQSYIPKIYYGGGFSPR